MGTIACFEDIQGWQKARELTQQIYAVTSQGRFAQDFGLRDQIRRASVSIMANTAEGFERDGSTEFRQFLAIAKGSAGEVKAHLYLALDAGFVDQATFEHLYNLAHEAGRMIAGFMRYLNNSAYKGNKYKQETRNKKQETRNNRGTYGCPNPDPGGWS